MLLTTTSICHYLIAKRIVSTKSIVDGAFAVIDVSRRNRNFKILQGDGPGYFVKQIQQWDPQTVAMLQCEAACYWLARHDVALAPLATLTPEFHWYDLERHILITGLIPQSENLYEHFRRTRHLTTNVSHHLGTQLGTYHRDAGTGPSDPAHSAMFPRQIPWILSSARRNSHPFKQLSAGTAQLFDTVEASVELSQALDDLRRDWRVETLIHGDLRFENCVLSEDAQRDEPTIKIVDWEMADIGDRSWDVGGIIQAYISAWVMSEPPRDRSGASTHVLRAVGLPITSLWDGYLTALGLERERSKALLERCLRFGAARLIQSAYEYSQYSSQVSPHAAHLLHVSEDMLRNPEASMKLLLNGQSA